MESQRGRPNRAKIVAILDFVLTLVLVIDIICFTVYPLWAHHYMETTVEAQEPFRPKGDAGLLFPHNSRYDHQTTHKISGPVLWTFLGAVILFGLIATLAAAALLKSTTDKVDPTEVLQMTRFWMHCNILTLLVTMVGSFLMFCLWMGKFRVGFPIPTLFYLGIRLIFTWAIFLSLREMKGPRLELSLKPEDFQEPRPRRYYGKFGYYSGQQAPEPPKLILGPYRGAKLSVPKCQCLAPQTV